MSVPPHTIDPEQVIERIDAAIRELEALRRQFIVPTPAMPDLAEKLFGALGQGTWDEYDSHLEWARFDAG